MNQSSYREKIFKLLREMQPGEVFVIEKKVAPNNKEMFIQVVKQYIDSHDYCRIEFNNSYKKIRST